MYSSLWGACIIVLLVLCSSALLHPHTGLVQGLAGPRYRTVAHRTELDGVTGSGQGEAATAGGAALLGKEEAHSLEGLKTPLPPANVQLAFINLSSVLLTWEYPSPASFQVQASHDGDSYLNASGLLRETYYTFTGMCFSGYYQFRVLAYQGGVASQPADTGYFLNGIDTPPGPPTGLQATATSYSELNLQWEGPHTPSPLLYLISWGGQEGQLNLEEQVYVSTHVSFTGLEPGHTYFFQMRADISGHRSIPTPVTTATTWNTELPAVMVESHSAGAQWVWLSWSAPPPERYPKVVTSFTVYWSLLLELAGDTRSAFTGHQSSSDRTANITGLQPSTAYVLSVGYSSGEFLSELSPFAIISTLDGVTCDSCEPWSPTEVVLHWKASAVNTQNVLYIFEITEQEKLFIAKVGCGKEEVEGSQVVGKLQPWTQHDFEVAVVSGSGSVLQRSHCPSCFTMEAAPSKPPAGVSVSKSTAQEITLDWSPPDIEYRNGVLTAYVIKYTCIPRAHWQNCSSTQVTISADNQTNLKYTVKKLTPFTNYTLQIAAETHAGIGPFAGINTTTLQATPSKAPDNIFIDRVTDMSLHLTWDPPAPPYQNGIITDYIVYYSEIVSRMPSDRCALSYFSGDSRSVSDVISLENIVRVPTTSVHIGALKSHATYTITVSAETLAGSGPRSAYLYASTLQSAIETTVDVNFTAVLFTNENLTQNCFSIVFNWTLNNLLLMREGAFVCAQYIHISKKSSSNGTVLKLGSTFETEYIFSGVEAEQYKFTRSSQLAVWLQIKLELLNGTFTSFRSHSIALVVPSCHVNGWMAPAVAAVSSIGFLFACGMIFTLLCICVHRRKRRMQANPPLIFMDDYRPPVALENEYTPTPDMRRSDGQSSSCSDSRSLSSVSSGFSDASDLCNPEASSLPGIPLVARQDPDGCSLSLSSIDQSIEP